MKKFLLFLMVLVSALFMVSCQQDNNNQNNNNNNQNNETNNPEVEPAPAESIIQKILAKASALGNQEKLEGERTVTGTVKEITDAYSSQYKNITFILTDGTADILVFRSKGECAATLKVGDTVTVTGEVINYEGTIEFQYAVLTVEGESSNTPEVDDSYLNANIDVVRNATVGDKFVVEGVVAQITYAFGQKPNGFYVVDETGAIYLYGECASSLKVGDTVKVAGTKDYYILEDEKTNAAKFGYKGCCQLKDLVLLEKNSNNSEWDKNWVSETTIKDVLETPVTENVTSTIYKVNALVKKVPGDGFVNYYFFDIDNKTSSYAYSQCNGSDYAWLDEFDGKICTVYISPLNCKATASDCFFRFIPIEVYDDNYTFNLSDSCNYALKYEVLDQFNNKYTSNPQLELITTVNSQMLGIENVQITYSSSNENVIYFQQDGDKLIMNSKNSGEATVTITATYNSNSGINVTKSATVVIAVEESEQFDTITVAEAIVAADETIVTVKGIVVSSLVNKVGFYISDETGIIAVTCESAALEDVKLGNMVVVQGRRIHHKKDGKTHAGQTVIFEAEILTNYYGQHEYDTSKFDTSKTLLDLYNLDENVDFSTTVYVVTATVKYEKGAYSSSYYLSAEGVNKFTLYSSGAGQYSWLEQYVDQEVTLEIAVCNWNDKSYYTGCVISVTYNGVKTLNNLNFEN